MAQSVEQGSLEAVLHIDVDKNDVGKITKELSDITNKSNVKQSFNEVGSSIEKSMQKGATAIDNVGKEIDNTARLATRDKGQIQDYSNVLNNALITNTKFGQSLSNLSQTSSGLSGVMGNVGSSVKAFGKTLLGLMANPAFLAVAGIGGAVAGFKFWYDYNKNIQEATKLTKEFTGKEGEDLQQFRNEIQAIADTFGKDFKETLQATDALAAQFGITFDEAAKVIKDGFIAGADLNGDFLMKMQQYPAYFKEAGLSAQEFVAIVSQTRSGIFGDQGLDAIKQANARIREMSTSTAKTLDKIGIDSKQVQKDLVNGSKTTFDVLQEVSAKLAELPDNSREVGETLMDVFGKQGRDAGLAMIRSLKDIDTNLEKVKKQTGELGSYQEQLLESQIELENRISDLFDSTGGFFEQLTTAAKLFVNEGLIYVLDGLKSARDWFIELWNTSAGFRKFLSVWFVGLKTYYKMVITGLKGLGKYLLGLGETLMGIVTFDWTLLKTGFKQLKSAFVDTFDEIVDNVKGAIDDVNEYSNIKIKVSEEKQEQGTGQSNKPNTNNSSNYNVGGSGTGGTKKEAELSYYEQLKKSIAAEEKRLESLSKEDAANKKLVDSIHKNIAALEAEKQAFEESISIADYTDKINEYQEYTQKLVAIRQDAANKIKEIEKNENLSESEKKKQIAKVNSFAAMREEQLNIDYNLTGSNEIAEATAAAIKGIVGMTAEELNNKIILLKFQLQELAKKSGTKDVAKQIALVTAQLEVCTQAFDELENEENETANKVSTDRRIKLFAQYFQGVADAVGHAINELDGLSDQAKETMNTILEFATSGMDMISNIDLLVHSTIQGEKVAAETAAQSISTVEKASVILAVISAAIQIAVKIANLFSNKRNKKANEQIETLQGQVDTLQESYDLLDEKIEKAYGNSAVEMINEQDTLLRQQKELIKQQIEAEKTKKSKKQDTDQIKEWEKQIKEIDKTLEGRQETIVEALIGKDYKSVLEDFSSEVMSAMDDAETSVDQATKNIAKSIKKAAVQTKLNEILQNDANKYADTLAKAMEDGFLSEFEKRNLEQIESTIASTSENYLKQFDDLWEKAEEERNGVSGGITNMSQDTAEEMNGRMTQIQSHTFAISETIKEMSEFSSRQLVVLQGIHTDTSSLVSTANSIRATLDDITIRGVKLKS